MPLELKEPRQGKSPNYTIRGTYLGVYVDKSAGTSDKAVAKQKLRDTKAAIERGQLSNRDRSEPTFLDAAVRYMEAGGERRYLGSYDPETDQWTGLVAKIGSKRLSHIDQAVADDCARELLPDGKPQTRNRQVYTPISAVLKHAGVYAAIKRPKGAMGEERTDWLWPEQAFPLFEAAKRNDLEFAIFIVTLLYTGMRLSEGLSLECNRTRIAESFAQLPKTKNGEGRGIHLAPIVVAALKDHPRGLDRPGERLFRFKKNARLYKRLDRVVKAADCTPLMVKGNAFHILCHTYATWMRRYSKLDIRGLVGTGRWRSETAARRYAHVVASEEAQKADYLPTPSRKPKRGPLALVGTGQSQPAESVENPWKGKKAV